MPKSRMRSSRQLNQAYNVNYDNLQTCNYIEKFCLSTLSPDPGFYLDQRPILSVIFPDYKTHPGICNEAEANI